MTSPRPDPAVRPVLRCLAAACVAVAMAVPPTGVKGQEATETGTRESAGTGAQESAAPSRSSSAPSDRAGDAAGSPDAGPPDWSRDLALFVSLLGFDTSVRGAARELRATDAVDDAAGIAEYFGDWQAVLPAFAAGSALVGSFTEGSRGLGKTLAILGGVAAGSMANEALNQAVGRRRPLEGRGAFSFDPFHGHASFPSGHAAFAFSMAGGVDAATEHWFPAAVAYTLAGGTAASRVHDGKHWVSDVVVGSVIGAAVSRWTTRRLMGALGVENQGDEEGPDEDGLVRRPVDGGPGSLRGPGLLDRIRPVATSRFIGISIRF